MILLLAALAHATCLEVEPEGLERFVPLGDGRLPVGSLVVREEHACEAGVPVRVLSVNPWYREAGTEAVQVGARGCLPAERLAPVTGPLLAQRAPPGGDVADLLPAGTLLSGCADDPRGLRHARALDPAQEAAMLTVRSAYEAHFGAASFDVPVTEWGRVGLPLPTLLDADAIAAGAAREALATDTQREKVVTALGPLRDGVPVYVHFLGADERLTDLWADPDALASLLGLLSSWNEHCTGALGRAREVCTVQIGDLSFYGPVRPDPLGHRDHLGRCVDLRLFRSDGSWYESFWNRPDDRPGRPHAYDAGLTRAFLAHALQTAPIEVAYFNDPAVHGPLDRVSPARGHDDHVHLCFGR